MRRGQIQQTNLKKAGIYGIIHQQNANYSRFRTNTCIIMWQISSQRLGEEARETERQRRKYENFSLVSFLVCTLRETGVLS